MYKVKELKMITADGWEIVGVEIQIEIERVNVLQLLFGAVHWLENRINLHRRVNSLKVFIYIYMGQKLQKDEEVPKKSIAIFSYKQRLMSIDMKTKLFSMSQGST